MVSLSRSFGVFDVEILRESVLSLYFYLRKGDTSFSVSFFSSGTSLFKIHTEASLEMKTSATPRIVPQLLDQPHMVNPEHHFNAPSSFVELCRC